jgi:hypothetical protein
VQDRAAAGRTLARWWCGLVVCCGASLLFRLWPGGRLERLTELPVEAVPLAVRSGRLYYQHGGFWSIPVEGGRAQYLGIRADETNESRRPIPISSGIMVPLGRAPGEQAVRFAEVPYDGSAPRHYPFVLPANAAAFSFFQGDCYWAAPRRVEAGGPSTHNLLATPLRGGQTRLVGADLKGRVSFSISDQAISTYSGAEPIGRSVIRISRTGERSVFSYQGGEGRRILFHGRLYWLNRDAQEGDSWSLASSRKDGSDARRVSSLLEHPPLFMWLVGKKKTLYYCSFERSGRSSLIGLTGPSFTPTAVTPEFPKPLPFMWVEADHLYLVAQHSRENWLDWSAKGLQAQTVPVLHRYRFE